jgi:hypothetical protein
MCARVACRRRQAPWHARLWIPAQRTHAGNQSGRIHWLDHVILKSRCQRITLAPA